MPSRYVERYARGAVVPYWGDPSQLFLQGAVTDPPYSHWGPEYWPRYDTYVKAILEAFGDDETVILWDVMGEPYLVAEYPWLWKLLQAEYDEQRVTAFLRHFTRLVASLAPRGAVTVGVGGLEGVRRVEQAVGELTDVLSVHWFGPDPEETRRVLKAVKAEAESRDKPLLLTEFGNLTLQDSWLDDSRIMGTDQGQLRYYQETLPVVEEIGIGWFAYRLVAGEGGFANSGLLYPSGLSRPAANWIRDRLAPKRR